MIIPDVNLLVYASNRGAPDHLAAKAWWESCLNGNGVVGLPWASLLGFVRLLSNPRVVRDPVRPEVLLQVVQSWLHQPPCRLVGPGTQHPGLPGLEGRL